MFFSTRLKLEAKSSLQNQTRLCDVASHRNSSEIFFFVLILNLLETRGFVRGSEQCTALTAITSHLLAQIRDQSIQVFLHFPLPRTSILVIHCRPTSISNRRHQILTLSSATLKSTNGSASSCILSKTSLM